MDSRIGHIVRQARQAAGLTLEDVAGRIGVTTGALSHIESGRRLPSARNAVRIAEVLSIPPDAILQALDTAHSSRRQSQAAEEMSGGGSATRSTSSRAFSQRPIEALFSNSMQRSHEDRQTRRVSRPDDHSLDLSPALRNTPEPDDSLNPRESQQCAMYMTEPEWLPSRRPDAYAPESSARDEARWSEDTALRLKALDYLADSAAEAIRTLRGLLEDEDPAVAREARRLLRELDVRTPEE